MNKKVNFNALTLIQLECTKLLDVFEFRLKTVNRVFIIKHVSFKKKQKSFVQYLFCSGKSFSSWKKTPILNSE